VQDDVLPGHPPALSRTRDDVVLVLDVLLALAGHQRLEGGARAGAVLLRHGALEPVLAEQLARVVAEHVAPVAVEHRDRAAGIEQEQDRPRDIEIGLRAVALRAQRLLGLLQPRLRGLERRDVDHHALARGRAPGLRVAQDRLALPQPAHAPVGGDHPELDLEVALGRERPLLGLPHPVAVVGVDAAAPELGLVDPRRRRVAEQRLDLGGHVLQRRVGAPARDVGHGVDLLDQRPVAALGLEHVAQRVDAVGDVDEDGREPLGVVALGRHGRERDLVPERLAVAAVVAQRDPARAAFRERRPQLPERRSLGVAPLQEAAVAPDRLLGRPAGQPLERLVDVDEPQIGVAHVGEAGRHPERVEDPRFARSARGRGRQ
jgi:hypothetical protein